MLITIINGRITVTKERELVRLKLEYNNALSQQTILTLQTKSKDRKKTVSNEPHISDIDQGVIYVFKIKEHEIEKLNIKTPYVYDILYAVVDGLIEKINNNPIWLNELHTLMKNKAYLQIKTVCKFIREAPGITMIHDAIRQFRHTGYRNSKDLVQDEDSLDLYHIHHSLLMLHVIYQHLIG
jgi:hypothetical protein